jgi:hypothetical protein
MIVSVAAVNLEVGVELMVDAAAVVLEKGARVLVGNQVGNRAGWGERAWRVGRHPGIDAENLPRYRIEAAYGNGLSGEHIARPGAIRILARGGGIIDGLANAAVGNVTGLHGIARCIDEHLGGLFFDELLITEEEESLVSSVIDFRQYNRAADIGFGVHEPGGYAVGISGLRVGSTQPVEIKAVRHAARPSEVRREAVQFIAAALFDD